MKQFKISTQITRKNFEILVEEFLTVSENDFELLLKEISDPIDRQFVNLFTKEKEIFFKNSETSDQFEQFKQTQE